MPVEDVAIKVNWSTDKLIESAVEKPKVGIYNANIDQSEPYQFKNKIKRVAVIGAGPAGLPTAKLLLDEGIQVKIYERNAASGGTWIYNEEKPINPEFPSEIPTKVVEPSLPPKDVSLPFAKKTTVGAAENELLQLTPPTPCYRSLRNNVPTPLLKYKDLEWRRDTPWFTSHDKILQYLQDYSSHFNLDDITEYNTSVENLEELPNQSGWRVLTKHAEYSKNTDQVEISWKEEVFDAVVVATGHYHAPYVPDLPGLSDWRNKWPENVIHSKQYRVPEQFKDKSVLLIGNGTSAIDIARDISSHVKTIYNSVRESHHKFDERYLKLREELSKFIPKNVQRVGNIKAFRFSNDKEDRIQDAVVELEDGTELTGFDYVIVCTGYVFSFHFLEHLHSDEHVNAKRQFDVDDKHVLVKDGTQVYNLHKDIFYIPNPTLSFVGIPFHIATFSLFEFQSYAIARVYADAAKLPTEEAMRLEWQERLLQKGGGREFHALGSELELAYIKDITTWVNRDGKALGKPVVEEHDQAWIAVKDQSLVALKKALNIE
ncbi:hypothetical protein V8B55DRAFT_1017362 [Mucor lusitanicus]|uniref:FAD/NAD(P)-binding domain-containing protein n=2 Tax=Mucor circinelloides f. lusitanicus TaxID=29924 RepID=A0A162QR80_MUCCL|nr:hypothetical protein FB192DRAFT_1465310 [Mucor lusitanicus]OAD01549.1 hypothetical protein MUCCIDRAFT_145589 [Mucor lusitanicus CBS 277.49]